MIILALLLAEASPQAYPVQPVPFAIGPGSATCEAAWSRDHAHLSFLWVQGYWSGLNSARMANVGAGREATEIVQKVRENCAKDPSQTLMSAVGATYTALTKP